MSVVFSRSGQWYPCKDCMRQAWVELRRGLPGEDLWSDVCLICDQFLQRVGERGESPAALATIALRQEIGDCLGFGCSVHLLYNISQVTTWITWLTLCEFQNLAVSINFSKSLFRQMKTLLGSSCMLSCLYKNVGARTLLRDGLELWGTDMIL